jgi:hypothetical protein
MLNPISRDTWEENITVALFTSETKPPTGLLSQQNLIKIDKHTNINIFYALYYYTVAQLSADLQPVLAQHSPNKRWNRRGKTRR